MMRSRLVRTGMGCIAASVLWLSAGSVTDGRVPTPVTGGDFDGDGLADVIVAGRVIFGKPDSTPVDLRQIGSTGIELNPRSFLQFVGDVNGDGLDDVVAQRGHRVAVVVFGRDRASADESPEVSGLRIGGLPRGQSLGGAEPAGDVNGDGLADVAITASVYPERRPPAAYVVLGRAAPDTVDLGRGSGVVRLARFGQHDLRAAGDLDGDGRDDLLAGDWADGGSCGEDSVGLAWTILSRPWRSSRGWTRTRARYDGPRLCLIGFWTGALGDINGDGRGDFGFDALDTFADDLELLVTFGSGRRGLVTVRRSRPIGLRIVDTTRGPSHVGEGEVAAVGDVNGDGLADVLVGSANQRLWLIYGSARARSVHLGKLAPSEGREALLASKPGRIRSPVGLGDVNGDGVPDFAVCASGSDGPHYLAVVFGTPGDKVPRLDSLGDGGFVVSSGPKTDVC